MEQALAAATGEAPMHLLCFASAGSTAAKFNRWTHFLPRNVKVIAMELPGRGQRWREALLYDFDEAVDSVMPLVMPFVGKNISFFGHSMGAFFCYEVAYRLQQAGKPLPAHMLIASVRAPQILTRLRPFTDLSDEEFMERVINIQGTPRAVLENASAMELYMPVLRADASLFDTMQCNHDKPLDVPISVYGGDSDPEVSVEDLQAWAIHTSKKFSIDIFPGGHFFYKEMEHTFLDLIAAKLAENAGVNNAAQKVP